MSAKKGYMTDKKSLVIKVYYATNLKQFKTNFDDVS